MSQKDYRADLIWQTLQRNYPKEIKRIHQMQHKDMQLFGEIQPNTERFLDELMDRVVEDNKRRRGEID